MALTLVGNLNASDQTFLLSGTPEPTAGDFLQIGDEQLLVNNAGRENTRFRVETSRGYNSTDPAAHTNGATVYRVTAVVQTDSPTAPPPATAGGPSTIYVSADDPGAIGARNLWLEVVFGDAEGDGGDGRLWARNSTDTGWNSASPLTYSDSGQTLVVSPNDVGEIGLNDTGGSFVTDSHSFRVGGGTKSIFLDAAGLHLGPDALSPLLISASTPDDPRSGGGLAAPKGSLFANRSLAMIWFKTGAGDTAWSYLIQSVGGENVADLAGDADLPTTVAKVNELLTALRALFVVG